MAAISSPLASAGVAGRDDFQSRRVDEPRFGVLTVERTRTQATIARRPNHPGHRAELTIVRGRGELDDAVEGAADEIGKLHFNHRTEAHERHACGHPGESKLRYRRIHHAPRAELGFKSSGHLERAAKVAGDVLAKDEDPRIAPHLVAERLADGRDVGQLASAAGFVDAGKTEVQDQSLLTAPRSISVLVPSFIGS